MNGNQKKYFLYVRECERESVCVCVRVCWLSCSQEDHMAVFLPPHLSHIMIMAPGKEEQLSALSCVV